jgi:hypothetical protein
VVGTVLRARADTSWVAFRLVDGRTTTETILIKSGGLAVIKEITRKPVTILDTIEIMVSLTHQDGYVSSGSVRDIFRGFEVFDDVVYESVDRKQIGEAS